MFVLRSSISVKVSTKIFGIIKQWGWEGEGGDQISIGGLGKKFKINKQGERLFRTQE